VAIEMSNTSSHEVTRLLVAWSGGDASAAEVLMPLVYEELRRLARAYLRRERGDHTLQPTALVHEAYLRLVDDTEIQWQSRAHFYGIAAAVMRRVLVDHARKAGAAKRGGQAEHISIEEAGGIVQGDSVDILALDGALQSLAQDYPRQSRVVELRFFCGLALKEIGEVLQISERSVGRDWEFARCWLKRELAGGL
jgi:RNA polymerase sigma factor (TIGR02999 family)